MCKISKLLYIIFLMGLISLISCDDGAQQFSSDLENVEEHDEMSQNPYSISKEEALNNLYSFLGDLDESSSRAFSDRTVKSISPIPYSIVKSRSSDGCTEEDTINCENLVYIANFDDEEGYAILAADSRITDKVIAVVEEGNLSDHTLYSALEDMNSDRPIYEDYPLTGEGLFTLPEYGDELFMNPNTVILYNDSVQDTMVGDFFIDDSGAFDDNGKPYTSMVPLGDRESQFTGELCLLYAEDELKGGNSSGTQPLTHRTNNPNDPIYIEDGACTYTDIINDTGWVLKKDVTPLLSGFRAWHQSSPFNDNHPRRRKYIVVGRQRRAPAGCFPLAISKVMAHFRHPDYFVDWNELCASYKSTAGRRAAAALLKFVSDGCGSLYFYAGTFTFPSNATSFMRDMGFNCAHNHGYDFNRIEQMLDNGKPVIISSIPGINLTKSHAWNIDGYKVKERSYTVRTFKGQTLDSSRNITERSELVHCDFGWEGKCNGYYASGVFKLNAPVEKDLTYGSGDNKTNYNHCIKIIDYEKP